MARQSGKESPSRGNTADDSDGNPAQDAPPDTAAGGMPNLVRRALSLGLSGLFTTEETVRKALGDTLPRDWIDFAVDQSGRTRQELLDRVSTELGRSLADIDFAKVLSQWLEGRTIEGNAQIKLAPADDDEASRVKVRLEDEQPR
jgi:hypothetical protein